MSAEGARDRCTHWPQTCAQVQARTPTVMRFCDFCLYGPEQRPVRRDQNAISVEEALARVHARERAVGDRLTAAVIAVQQQERER